MTDAEGKYSFVGLALGEYTVSVVDPTSGPLAGTKPTEAYTGRYKTVADVTIAEATGSVIDVDFGLVAPATIGDRVWNDEDGNGADNGEPGIPNATVILTDANGTEVARTTTDANGNYRFAGLIPGTYTWTSRSRCLRLRRRTPRPPRLLRSWPAPAQTPPFLVAWQPSPPSPAHWPSAPSAAANARTPNGHHT